MRRLGHRLRLDCHQKGLRGAKRKRKFLISHIGIKVSAFVHLVRRVFAKTSTTDTQSIHKPAYLPTAQDAEIRVEFIILT
jgi:hypothetical protein